MPQPSSSPLDPLGDLPDGLDATELASLLAADLRRRRAAGEPAAVEQYLEAFPALAQQPKALLQLVAAEWRLRREQDPPPSVQEYSSRFPTLAQQLERLLLAHAGADPAPTEQQTVPPAESLTVASADPHGTRARPAARSTDAAPRYGKYRLIQSLGRGGMGDVYLAEDERLERQVALKLMRPEYAAVPEYRQRFLREARLAASLEHDHVVPIFEVGEEGKTLFLVMPLLRGRSLEDRLKAQPCLPLAQVLRIGREIAQGLAAAHAEGLVHRDIKPANIWLEAQPDAPGALGAGGGASGTEGRVKILDFGLARRAEGGEGMTHAGSFLGTPGYAAPEQVNGQSLDGRADLFSLGAVLYRMAAGLPAFRGEGSMGLVLAVLEQEPVPPHHANPAVPPALSDLILRLLAKDPAGRPRSAPDVVKALRALEAGGAAATPVLPPPPLAADRATQVDPSVPPRRSRKKWVLAAGAGLGLLGLVALAWSLRTSGEAGPKAPEQTKGTPPPAGNPAAQAAPVQVRRLEVEHFAGESGEACGLLGVDSFVTQRDDDLKLQARLSRPSWAFLLSFRPDGVEELVFPDARPRYPGSSGARAKRYALNDGEGLQVFAVVVLHRPLAYRDWKSRRGLAPWGRHTAPPDVVWWDDGAEIERLTATDRKKGKEVTGASRVAGLTDWLRKGPEVETAAALGFAVLPKGKR
jgi:serine/threonine protein kinase